MVEKTHLNMYEDQLVKIKNVQRNKALLGSVHRTGGKEIKAWGTMGIIRESYQVIITFR